MCRSHQFPGLSRSHYNSHCGGFSRLEPGTTTPLPPRSGWCPCGFPPHQKKKIYQPLKIHDNINKPKYQMVRSYIKFKINLQAEHTNNNQKINIK